MTTPNPYPGLRPFRDDEVHLFFGRESQVDSMVDKLAASRFLAVVGASGSGKSSLVNCGLRPALHRGLMANAGTSWRIVDFRPGNAPIRSLATALARKDALFRNHEDGAMPLVDIVDATLRMSKRGLLDICEQADPDGTTNLLIIADQFEELFRFRTGIESVAEETSAFINLLLEPRAEAGSRVFVVLTMRSDFLGDCAQLSGLPEAINAGQYLVPRMTRDERRQAIAGPAAVSGAAISAPLMTRLVNDVGDMADQLSILQHALNRTWARWFFSGADGAIEIAHYEAIGTMATALDRHADKAYAELTTDRERAICATLFKALTDKGTDARGIRRPTEMQTLCDIAEATPDEVQRVIDVFRQTSRSFLMPPLAEALTPTTMVDISHESLMRVWRRLRDWVDEEAASASTYVRIAEDARLHAKGETGVLVDPELSLLLGWWEKRTPNAGWARRYHPGFAAAKQFLEQSRDARDAKMRAETESLVRQKRRTRLVAGVIGVMVLVAAAFGAAFVSQSRLTKKLQIAQADALTAMQSANESLENLKAAFDAQNALSSAEANVVFRQAVLDSVRADSVADRIRAQKELDKASREAARLAAIAAASTAKVAVQVANGTAIKYDGMERVGGYFTVDNVRVIDDGGVSRPTGLFTDSPSPSDNTATFFVEGRPEGFPHTLIFQTKTLAEFQSVLLFAAHDDESFGVRRAFKSFDLFAQKGEALTGASAWALVARFTPALPYGGPAYGDYQKGTTLGVCLRVPATTALSFKAVFVQAVEYGQYSSPRVLRLNAFANPTCNR